MAWFFESEEIKTEHHQITGENARHITKSLRMKVGEHLTLCTLDGKRHECVITEILNDTVNVKILSSTVCEQEPDIKVTLFVALLKGDKFDDVIQKSVELGVYEIIPFISARCISRPEKKQIIKKCGRWQKIAENAASQSRRAIIPKVRDCISINDIDDILKDFDKSIVFYECGGEKLKDLVKETDKKIALITGCEGGFEESEIDMLKSAGVKVATLGKRILRAQTAPIAALCSVMFISDNLE